MYENLMSVLQSVFTISATICIGGACLLLSRSDGIRARRFLACIYLFWGSAFVARVIGIIAGNVSDRYSEVLPSWLIAGGTMAAIVLLVWPLEIVKPGWLTVRKFVKICLPFIVLEAIYRIVIVALGVTQVRLSSIGDFASHFSNFSVWFRLILCCCTLAYIVYLLHLISSFSHGYELWCDDNFSSTEKFDIEWLNGYGIGTIAITVLYFINLIVASPVSMMAHNVIVAVFFSWVLVKSLTHINPYPERYFAKENGFERTSPNENGSIQETELAFEERIDEYKDKILRWFDTDKPYLQPGFKLMDIMTELPLNRTYLSRIFNEGFGKSFNAVVREYRIEEAKKLMLSNPAISLTDVACKCGYSTPQAFHRAFSLIQGGQTPGQFLKSSTTGKQASS